MTFCLVNTLWMISTKASNVKKQCEVYFMTTALHLMLHDCYWLSNQQDYIELHKSCARVLVTIKHAWPSFEGTEVNNSGVETRLRHFSLEDLREENRWADDRIFSCVPNTVRRPEAQSWSISDLTVHVYVPSSPSFTLEMVNEASSFLSLGHKHRHTGCLHQHLRMHLWNIYWGLPIILIIMQVCR